jgi:hypothetical protein
LLKKPYSSSPSRRSLFPSPLMRLYLSLRLTSPMTCRLPCGLPLFLDSRTD